MPLGNWDNLAGIPAENLPKELYDTRMLPDHASSFIAGAVVAMHGPKFESVGQLVSAYQTHNILSS